MFRNAFDIGIGPSFFLAAVGTVTGLALSAGAVLGFDQVRAAHKTYKTIETTAPQAFDTVYAPIIEKLNRGNLRFRPDDSIQAKAFKICARDQADDAGTPIYGTAGNPAFNRNLLKDCFVNETTRQVSQHYGFREDVVKPLSYVTAGFAAAGYVFAAFTAMMGIGGLARRSNGNSAPPTATGPA